MGETVIAHRTAQGVGYDVIRPADGRWRYDAPAVWAQAGNGIEAGKSIAYRSANATESAAHQDFAVGLQRDGIHCSRCVRVKPIRQAGAGVQSELYGRPSVRASDREIYRLAVESRYPRNDRKT